jgi:hypothetical protein
MLHFEHTAVRKHSGDRCSPPCKEMMSRNWVLPAARELQLMDCDGQPDISHAPAAKYTLVLDGDTFAVSYRSRSVTDHGKDTLFENMT